jgi:phosphomevalonate kinase
MPGLAVRAHRRAQGGRGSGYDVICSFHGGAGIFKGGTDPSWEPCRIPGDPDICLFSGPRAVSTSDAVGRYEEWKKRNPRRAREFLEESNKAVLSFIRAASAFDVARRFAACRRIGIRLGEEIGVKADLEAPAGLDPLRCKAVGAGNELGACLFEHGAPIEGTSLQILRQDQGLVWEE